MAHIKMPDRGGVGDRKMAKLQQEVFNMERQMAEQAQIRKKIEHLQSLEQDRMNQAEVRIFFPINLIGFYDSSKWHSKL